MNNNFFNESKNFIFIENNFEILEFFYNLKINKKILIKIFFISGLIGTIFFPQKRVLEESFKLFLLKKNHHHY